MTAGAYLKNILKEKSIPISYLTNKLGLSSRNTLYRLFNGNLSSEKQKIIIKNIVEQIQLSEEETETLETLMKEGEGGKFYDEINRILMNVYTSCEGGYSIDDKTLYDILCTNKVEFVTMFGIKDEKIICDMYKFLAENPEVTVYHYMKFPKINTQAIYEILALIRLSEFPNYVPLELEGLMQRGIYIISRDENSYVLQMAEFTPGGSVLLETQISETSYKYILDKDKRLQGRSTPIKRQIDRVQSYMNTLEETLEIEEGDSFYCEGAPCFGYLPMEILYEMFEGIDFFGYPKNHPYVQNLVVHIQEKNKRLYSLGHKRFLYDEKHLRAMMETGFAIDHVSEFPPMNIEQRRSYFKWLIEYLNRDDKNITCRLLKDVEIEHSYVYEEGHMLYMYRPNTELNNMDVSVIMLKNRGVDEIMKHFTDYLWNTHTLSETETVAELERLAGECLGI